MQSNKNIAEIGARYVGAEVNKGTMELYSSGAGEWYIAAPKVLLKRHYPLFYDSVYFDRNNDPTESVATSNTDGSKLYMPISCGTAQVLQLKDGYAELASLMEESRSMSKGAVEVLQNAQRHPICAQIETRGSDNAYYVLDRVPEKPGAALQCLSTLDKWSVDLIGTLAYNVAIPVMAPFRFFAEFFTND